MDRKGANTFLFYNLPPEPRAISIRNFSVLLSFPFGENKRRWRLLLPRHFREPALNSQFQIHRSHSPTESSSPTGLFPHGVIFSYRFIHTIIFVHHPQQKRRIRRHSPAAIRDLFSPAKTSPFHTSWYMHIRNHIIQPHLWWEHHCLIHIMHRIWLTFIFQERCSQILKSSQRRQIQSKETNSVKGEKSSQRIQSQ